VKDLLPIHISRHQEGAGYQQWRRGSLSDVAGCQFEVLQSSPVAHSAEGEVHPLIPGLEVELETATRFQREAEHLLEERRVHGAIGLPANAKDVVSPPLPGQARNQDRMRKLWSGITAEETDAGGGLICPCGKLGGSHLRLIGGHPSKMPVLTEEAVKGAGLIKDRQILIAVFRASPVGEGGIASSSSPRANPIGNAVGGKGIIIPAQIPLCGRGSQKLAVLHSTCPAKASFSLGDLAFIDTDPTGKAGAMGRSWGESKTFPGLPVRSFQARLYRLKILSDTVEADTQKLGNER